MKRLATRIFLIVSACLTFSVSAPAVDYGQVAPDFTLTDSWGEQHTLSQYRGRVVFLQFFGWS